MAKTKISEFSSTPGNNTDIDSINIAEGCAPSGINDAIRELMAQLKDFQTGAVGDSFNGPVGTTTAAAGSFTTLAYTGALTGGTSVVNLGSGQFYKDASGNVGIGTSSPAHKLHVAGNTFVPLTNSYYCYTADYGMGTPDSGGLQLFSGSSDSIRFGKRASGTFTENARIDSSGNLGIGTNSPGYRLDVAATDTTAGFGYGFRVRANSTAGAGSIQFTDNPVSTQYGVITGSTTEFKLLADGRPMTFFTGGLERARIDSSGNLLVGTTSANARFVVIGNGGYSYCTTLAQASETGNVLGVFGPTNGTTQNFVVFAQAGILKGTISTNGSTTAYNTSSDYRLKENIAPMTGALAKVSALKPCTYKWKINGSDGEGFIAHELAEVVPQCVTGEKDAVDAEGKPVYQGIDTSFLVATLTAAIQELKAIVDAQGAEIAALKGTV